jgi:hypothetical protein
MTSGSSDRTPPERAEEARLGTPDGESQPPRERFGPLALLRTRKADGRALLLFSHEDGER